MILKLWHTIWQLKWSLCHTLQSSDGYIKRTLFFPWKKILFTAFATACNYGINQAQYTRIFVILHTWPLRQDPDTLASFFHLKQIFIFKALSLLSHSDIWRTPLISLLHEYMKVWKIPETNTRMKPTIKTIPKMDIFQVRIGATSEHLIDYK